MLHVFALKYGERQTTACQFFFREASHAPVTLHFYVWAILGGPYPVIVDTGFGAEDAAERGIANFVSPAAMVERLGVRAADVPLVLVTHLHWDHWAGHSLFPSAQFWIQKEEIAFWTGPVARYEAYKVVASAPSLSALVRMSYAGRVRVVEGEREVFPGLDGHTAGLQIVTVETAQGRIVLTSDAAHFYRNVERYQPAQLFTSLPQMLAGFDTIHALAGDRSRIVAGHDPEVAERFKPLEPGVVQIA
jgi:glyoxylase-like metal-dependent hydrolase (beta-lactamase superfamily II)